MSIKKYLFVLFLFNIANAQTLTVEKIMRDPKWIGTSPSSISWSYDSRHILFDWNPEAAISDSTYRYKLNGAYPLKLSYRDAGFAAAINSGTYNRARNKIVFVFNGDIYMLEPATGKTKRITQTEENESRPGFIMQDEWISFQQGADLFAWQIATGVTRQLTRFEKEKPKTKKNDAQAEFLQQQQLNSSDVLKERKEKRAARTDYLKEIKDTDTLHIIYTGSKTVRDLQVSPNGRFVTYNLFSEADNVKRAVVPNYLAESGYTAELQSHSKVGVPRDSAVFYVFDRMKDTIITVNTDMLPGIKSMPAYYKDYPLKAGDSSQYMKKVNVQGVNWNDEGTAVVLDIRSQDFKDRWLMVLDATNGKMKLLDQQHDDAWIGGPGIGWLGGSATGWVNDHTFYYESDASGYAHLYTANTNTLEKKQLTKGNYEVQEITLSNDKKHFYIITNEEHPGKKGFYRINTNGSNKTNILASTGGYEVSISPDEKYIAYRYSTQNKPWELYYQENAPGKKPVQVTTKATGDEWKAYPWRDTKIFSFKNSDGLPVYARVYEPAAGKKNNAAVIFVHGAGYLQNITYSWSYYFREFMFNNLLADEGYTVLDIDYRASAGYGRDWRTAIYRHMGGKDLDDEVEAAKLLVKDYGIDPARIGMYGGSYGGFITLMALFTKPGVFNAGAALRPVTDWAHYDDGYTAAILNEPANDSIAYARSSPINFASGLKDNLLICHGMLDVNVNFQDVVRLNQRLVELGKDNWELAAYPVEDHSFVEPSSWTDEYKRILKLFNTNLLKK